MQKAAKSLASRNSATLQRTHLITLALHALFHILRLVLLARSLLYYFFFCLPALATELYLDVLGRPKYAENGTPVRAGEDLQAKGLTEYMWDVVYWTWINLGLVILFGDRAWWLYMVVPLYTAYAITTTVGGIRETLSGLGSAGSEGQGQSNRQKKMEKRGGQKVAYR